MKTELEQLLQTELDKITTYYGFREHHLYKLSHNMEDPKLRNKTVTFHGYSYLPGDIHRAVVRLLNSDGSCGEEWLVRPPCVVPF